ncbi:MAG: FAD-binding oxidoreductase, partial [Betaproteobacteria bacterium]|nr:FAD-binding oxidoreductase [Betaproteobacteria bacterium]
MRGFNEVLAVDAQASWVDTEGMITYEDLTRECLAHGVMPAVVPQLKTITLGGAVAGVGIESSSHRYGLVHDTMLELDVLLGDGRVVTCTATNEHSDLFFGFPNSYGTLGYALRVRAKAVRVKPYVHLQHVGFASPGKYFDELGQYLRAGAHDFVDGTVFSPDRMYITLGRFADKAPYTSDYTFEHIYSRSIAEKREDYLTIHD